MSRQRLNPHLRHMEAARARRLEEDRRQRVMVIIEFDAGDPDATMHALAGLPPLPVHRDEEDDE